VEARRSLLVEEKRDRRRGEVEDELRAPERPPALARLRPFELVEELSPGGERPARVREGERESDRQRERERERERERKRKRKREIERERERERESESHITGQSCVCTAAVSDSGRQTSDPSNVTRVTGGSKTLGRGRTPLNG